MVRIEHFENILWRDKLWFMRPNIHWVRGQKAYTAATFSTQIGPTHSWIEGGLHELAHAVDFAMLGRINRVEFDNLVFVMPWINAVCIGGRFYNDFPQTSRCSWNEIRTNVIQAIMMEQAFGTFYHVAYAGEEEHLTECNAEERFRKEARAGWSFDDAATFHNEEGRHKPIEECYFDAYMRTYQQLNTPQGIKRISRALDRVSNRLGKLRA